MSKYASYARKLDAAFKTAREQYTDAYEAVKKAQKRVEDVKFLRDERFTGDADLEREDRATDLRKAEIVFEKTEANVWPAFDAVADELTAELKKAVAADSLALPEDIDPNGMTLLQSGILRPEELEALLDRYADNRTMIRVIGRYAKDAADTEKDPERREQLAMTYTKAAEGLDGVLRAWDDLLEAAKVCSGRSRETKEAPGFVTSISQKWEQLTEKAVEEF